jgi:hypothetical protein
MTLRSQQLHHPLIHRLVPAVLLASLMLAGPLSAQTFTVNSTGDDPATVLDGECATDNLIDEVAECTLRAALQEANQMGPVPVEIHFDIAGCPDDHCVIEIDSQDGQKLPVITSPVVLDGSTQPGNEGVCQSDIVDRPAYRVSLQGNGGEDVLAWSWVRAVTAA